ncbi:MAG: hypothetical protein PHY34_06420 [Patescibacteria group bacterium]|nr:hypothetical protein [Patescibacteria group bacterium]
MLFLVTEVLLYSNRADLVSDHWNKFIINEATLLDTGHNYDYIVMGDSVQKTGIIVNDVSDSMVLLTLPGGKPMGLYYLFRRYLYGHTPPKAVFVYVDPFNPRDSFNVILRYFVSVPEFLDMFRDLTWKEKGVFAGRYFASLDLRKVDLVRRETYPGTNRELIDVMRANNGHMPSPTAKTVLSKDFFDTNKDRLQARADVRPRDMKYLARFMELAEEHDVDVVFMGIVLPKGLHSKLFDMGFNEDYVAFYERLRSMYPNAYFVDDPVIYMDNGYFGDHTHLNSEGSAIFTEYFKNNIFLPYLEKKNGPHA